MRSSCAAVASPKSLFGDAEGEGVRRSWFWRWFTILATAIMLPLQLAIYLPDLQRGFVTFLLVTVAGNFLAYCWMMMVYGSGAFGMFKTIWLPWRDRPSDTTD